MFIAALQHKYVSGQCKDGSRTAAGTERAWIDSANRDFSGFLVRLAAFPSRIRRPVSAD